MKLSRLVLTAVFLQGAIALAASYPSPIYQALTILGLTTQGVVCNSAAGVLSTSATGCAGTVQSAATGGTGIASPTAHTIGVNEGSSAQNNTGVGALGTALMGTGSSTDPAFRAGAWTLLNTISLSGNSVSDTTSFGLGYTEYEIDLEGVIASNATATCSITFQVGGSFATSSYYTQTVFGSSSSSGAANSGSGGGINCFASGTPSGGAGASAVYRLSGPASTTTYKEIVGSFYVYSSTAASSYVGTVGGAYLGSTSAVTGIQFSLSGSFTYSAGALKIYGRM